MTSEEERLPNLEPKVKIAATSAEKKKNPEKTANQINAAKTTYSITQQQYCRPSKYSPKNSQKDPPGL